jgi:membrane associated rhomboid family serine protease
MKTAEFIVYGLIGLNVLYSLAALERPALFEQGYFRVGNLKYRKEWWRLLSSGFLHVDIMHLMVNMYTLYMFGPLLLSMLGASSFLQVYLGSLIGGNLLSLWVNRKQDSYTAVGASGAITGVVFATVVIVPQLQLSLMFLPIGIPGWLFALLYTLFSIWGVRSMAGNVGHDAHLGGGISGTLILLALNPVLILYSWKVVMGIMIPSLAFFFILWLKPHWFRK